MKLHLDVKLLLRQGKFAVLALVFSLTAFTAPLSAWAAEKTQFRFKGTMATAFFDAEDECIDTFVGVRAFEGIEREGPGKPAKGSAVEVFVDQFNFCDETLLLSAESITDVSASEFQIDKKLASARLTKTVELTDAVSGRSFAVSVDLTWTATGQPEVIRNRFYLRTPGRTIHEQDKGTFREATTAGTVSSAPTNFLQNLVELFADLQSVTDGFREMTKF
jgi:hypothetical protein